ncbi:MAG: hypothetical protein LUC43_02010 [Burkholderiales bacterium]|nr:hypothetical protein [Burkholderiales bacterium]
MFKIRSLVVIALCALIQAGSVAMAADNSTDSSNNGKVSGIYVLEVDNLKSRIDNLEVDRRMCRRELLRLLIDNVAYHYNKGALTDEEADNYAKRLQDFILECKEAGKW